MCRNNFDVDIQIIGRGEQMICLKCKHFKRLKDGQKGSIKGSCKLKCSDSYQDWRYGRQKACKTYFELKGEQE